MDKYGGYVLAAYLLSVAVIGGLGLKVWMRGRETRRLLARLSQNASDDHFMKEHGDPGRT
ncbi:MAG: heme exporter protein CcmD [Pseudomonadota bacterium]